MLRRLADGAMEPIPMSSFSFRPAADGHLNPLLLPIQLPYLMVDRIITRVESVLQLTAADRVRPFLAVGSLDVATIDLVAGWSRGASHGHGVDRLLGIL